MEVTGFGPYLDRQTVDFEALGEHGLFLIHGPTGSGKSSVLDAICFALFGATSGGERDGTDFVTTLKQAAIEDPQDWPRTEVVFEFEHLGKRFRVTRFPTQERAKKRGEGTLTEQTEGSLEDLTSGKVLASKPTDVTAAIQQMLRCDVDQFRQTVVLPQGAFRKVVTDHKARRSILATIFQTRRFARLAERLKAMSADLGRAIEAKEKERTALLEGAEAATARELEAFVEKASADEKAAGERKATAGLARNAALKAKTDGEHLAGEFDELDHLRLRQKELEAKATDVAAWREQAARAQRAARLAGDAAHLEAQREEVARLAGEVARARKALEAAEAEVASAQAAQAKLEERRDELEAAERHYQNLKALKPQVDSVVVKRAQRGALVDAVKAAEKAVRGAEAQVGDSERQLSALAEERKQVRSLASGASEAREAVARLEMDLAALTEIRDLQGQLAAVEEALHEIESGEDPLDGLTQAVRDHAPGLLADTLTEGEPCPVCGSVHHASPAAADGGIEALNHAFKAFGTSAAAVEVQKDRARSVQASLAKVVGQRGWTETIPPRDGVEAARRAAEEERAEREAAAKRVEDIDSQIDTLNGAIPQQREALMEANRAAEEARTELAGAEAAIHAVLEGLAEEHRDPEAFQEALTTAEESYGALKATLDAAAERTNGAREAHGVAAATVKTLEGQATTAGEALERLEETFARKLAREDFADRDDLEAATLPEEELEALSEQVQGYDQEVATVAHRLAELTAKLEGKARPDLEALTTAYEQAETAFVEAEKVWTEAWKRSSGLAEAWSRFQAIERQQGELRERATAAKRLSDTANGQLTGRARVDFETFVLQSIFHQVLQTANHHLHHMTGGRYSLHLRMDGSASSRGLELDVSDHASGGEMREVRTLSGGEGFMASLSLALALSEIAQQQSGGSELGALFVDEGFGSLDQRTLAQVVEILRGLQEDHRMVGVISHVDDLKRSIPVQLLVEPAERGSRIRVSLNA